MDPGAAVEAGAAVAAGAARELEAVATGVATPAGSRTAQAPATASTDKVKPCGVGVAPLHPLTVAVTGSAGFIGSHVVDRLLALGHRVCGVDNLSYGLRENFEHHLGHPGFSFHKVDVRDLAGLAEATDDCDAFIHLAAFKIPRYGNALATLQVNHAGAAHVLELARRGCRKVVLASTSDVYGMSAALPFDEEGNLVLGPSTVKRWSYAVSKLFDEHLGLAYAEEYGLPVVALRFFGTYGPRHHLSWWGGPQSVFFSCCLEGKPIPIHGDGLQTRSFTFIDDLVEGIVVALLRDEADGRVLNLGSQEEVAILELARQVHHACGNEGEPRLEFVPYSSFTGQRYDDVRRRVPDCTLAAQLLGWQVRVRLAEGLALTAPWHRLSLTRRPERMREEPAALEATR
ncbi:MAG: NAD-dependent epimerase/dehydratase family protein [Deltaproteobacteria bacterium]|nr:NAD-dependent epimerase/dehydratase family protein [Deltaproteobacteria bacterium]